MKAGDLVIYYDPSCSTPPQRVLLLELFHENSQALILNCTGSYLIDLEDIGIDMNSCLQIWAENYIGSR